MSSTALRYLDNINKKTSWYHRVDPRIKLLHMITFGISNMIFIEPLIQSIFLLHSIIICISARVRLRDIWPQLMAILVMLVSITIAQSFTAGMAIQAGTPLHVIFKLGSLEMTWEGLSFGLVRSLRIGNPLFLGLIFLSTTDPTMFAKSLTKIGVPIEISFMLLSALRLFPLLFKIAQDVSDAQTVRGVRGGGIRGSYEKLRLAIFPLFLNSLHRARSIGLTVECKAFGARGWNEFLRDPRIERIDYIMIVFCICMLAVSLYVRLVLGIGWAPTFNPY